MPLKPESTVAELQELEQRLARAWVASDRATIESIIAEDWTTVRLDGAISTREQVFREMLGAEPVVKSMSIDDVRVRPLGEAAVVTGRTAAVGMDGTGITLRFTDVAVWRDGRWRIVASHGTRIP